MASSKLSVPTKENSPERLYFCRRVWLVLSVLLLTACDKRPARHDLAGQSWFEDVTQRAGLEFLHQTGPATNYFMPLSMGSGGAMLDIDNDGRMDVYLIHCAAGTNQLFHQQANGTFRNVSTGSGLDVSGYGMGVAAGDVNNDGLPDVLLTEYGRTRLFVNHGAGKFKDSSSVAGIENTTWGMSASFLDYDRDGWLDLVIANYIDYIPSQQCFDTRNIPEFCGPQGFNGLVPRLFRNEGTGKNPRFQDVTIRSGLAKKTGPGLGVLCADFDGDRWPDIFVADDGAANRLFLNQRDGTFKEEAAIRGLAFNGMGGTAANMGVGIGDVDGDLLFDLFVTHLNWEQHSLWRQEPRGVFQERTALSGLTNPRWRGTGFGASFGDFDCDGDLDLAYVNGSIRRVTNATTFWSAYAQRNQIFRNEGSGKFVDVSEANLAFAGTPAVGRGLISGDLNNDGALDLLLVNTASAARFLQGQSKGNWLIVRAVDPSLGGRDAYGAEIIVEAEGRRWWRLVQPGYSYLVSNDPRVHLGLGSHTKVDLVRVIWPDGTEETFPGINANQVLVLRKGAR